MATKRTIAYNGDLANKRLMAKVVNLVTVKKMSYRAIAGKLGITKTKVGSLIDAHRNGRLPCKRQRPPALPLTQEAKMMRFIEEHSKIKGSTKSTVQRKV